MASKKKAGTETKTAAKRKAPARKKDGTAKSSKSSGLTAKDLIIKVCVGNGGIAGGSQDVISEFTRELKSRGIKADVAKMCVNKTGCRGFCAKDVIVEVSLKGNKEVYQRVTPDKVGRIVEEHIINGEPVFSWLVSEEYYAFHDKQTKVILEQCGQIDPEDIYAYVNGGGYRALEKALELDPFEVIEEVKYSGLRGRGGGGFLTGLKWEFCSMSAEQTKYIICNADEGDPGAFMDRALIEANPHAIIEGLVISGYAIGATQGYVFTRKDYELTIMRLDAAIKQARKKGYLGKNILGSDYSLDITIHQTPGAYICGEETALIASMEGKRGMPRSRPPFPVNKGLWGKPTVINNVETLANVPPIINKGAAWYLTLGMSKNRGTKVFALSGNIKNTGVIEVPMGMSVKEIIYDIGGGLKQNRELKAIQTAGPMGGCIPASHIDMPVGYESFINAGSMLGSGIMTIIDDTTCIVDMAKFSTLFNLNESCGKCVPCRVGTKRMHEILTRITDGKGKSGDIDLLIELGTDMKETALCGLGQSAPNPVLSSIRWFRDEFEAHIDGRCPAAVCESLRQYVVKEDTCKMCGKCARVCPTGAVVWERRQKAEIDITKCVKCGSCFDACPFKAIM
jgi:NADH-quinone oxidoreductase subunit F